MIEFLLGFLHIYAMCGFFIAIFFPMFRGAFSEERFFIRKPGETDAELIGKTLLAALGWPAIVGAVGYYWLTNFIIPWLTKPKR